MLPASRHNPIGKQYGRYNLTFYQRFASSQGDMRKCLKSVMTFHWAGRWLGPMYDERCLVIGGGCVMVVWQPISARSKVTNQVIYGWWCEAAQ